MYLYPAGFYVNDAYNNPSSLTPHEPNNYLSDVKVFTRKAIELASMSCNGQASIPLAHDLRQLAEKINLLANHMKYGLMPCGQDFVPHQNFNQPNGHTYIPVNQPNGQIFYQDRQTYEQNVINVQTSYYQTSNQANEHINLNQLNGQPDSSNFQNFNQPNEQAPYIPPHLSHLSLQSNQSNEGIERVRKVRKIENKLENFLQQPMQNLFHLKGNWSKHENISKDYIKNIKWEYTPNLFLTEKKINKKNSRQYISLRENFIIFSFTFETEIQFPIERIAKFFFERISLKKVCSQTKESQDLNLEDFVIKLEGATDFFNNFDIKFKLFPERLLISVLNGAYFNFYFEDKLMKENFYFRDVKVG